MALTVLLLEAFSSQSVLSPLAAVPSSALSFAASCGGLPLATHAPICSLIGTQLRGSVSVGVRLTSLIGIIPEPPIAFLRLPTATRKCRVMIPSRATPSPVAAGTAIP